MIRLSLASTRAGRRYWERDGIVDKLIGDAILAIFNFPIERHDHVKNAVLSAIALQERWATRRSVGEGDSQMPIGVGVGIHTGTVAVGDVGEACRDFTAVGSVVNLASRLQGAARRERCSSPSRCMSASPSSFRTPQRGSAN